MLFASKLYSNVIYNRFTVIRTISIMKDFVLTNICDILEKCLLCKDALCDNWKSMY